MYKLGLNAHKGFQMVNAEYMKVLAQLESAACTQKEKDVINMVRGRYVQQFGTDDNYVNALGKLEAAAATQAEKDQVNVIRGKYGYFDMTEGITESAMQTVPYDEQTASEDAAYDYKLDQEENAMADDEPDIYAMISDVTGYPVDQVQKIVDSFETVERKFGPKAAEGFAKLLPFSQADADRQVEGSLG